MDALSVSSADEWRAWLARHGRSESEVWLVLHHRGSGTPGVGYGEAIEHALCFGWIDSQARKRDAGSFHLRFTPRTAQSRWSRVNRRRAAEMIDRGLMTEHGRAVIEAARANGTWQVIGEDDGSLPDDLRELLDHDDAARANFGAFPPSSRRRILEWIATAKRPETRRRRVERTVELAALNVRANHPGVPASR